MSKVKNASPKRPAMPVKTPRAPAADPITERMGFFKSRMLGKAWPNIIAGRQDVSGRAFEVACPFDRNLVTARPVAADQRAVQAAAEAAARAQAIWSGLKRGERQAGLERLGKALQARRLDLALALVFERASTRAEALAEADAAAGFFIGAIERPAEMSRACGVAGLIVQSGEPLRVLCAMLAAAISGGNAAVMRPQSQAGLAAAIMMQAVAEAGLPEGLINMLCGEDAAMLLADCAGVDVLAYAGPAETGLKLQRKALGRDPARPFVYRGKGRPVAHVTRHADLEHAAAVLVAASFTAAGAGIGGISTVLAESSVSAKLVQLMRKTLDGLASGSPADPATGLSGFADTGSAERHDRAIKLIRQKGKVLAGGDMGRPAIAGDIPRDHALARDELFLPLMVVEFLPDFGAGMARAASLPSGNLSCLFSGRAGEARLFRKETRACVLAINPESPPCGLDQIFTAADFRARRVIR